MSRLGLVPLALFPLLSSAACSGGSASTLDSFISQYCDLYSPCCAKAGLPANGQQCRAVLTAFSGLGQYDSTAGGACIDALRAKSSSADFCAMGGAAPQCDNVFNGNAGGTKMPGETCSKDSDCAASSEGKVRCETYFMTNAETKTCVVEIVGKAGDMPCIGTVDGNITYRSGTGAPPPRGYLCDRKDSLRCNDTTKACVALSDLGAACTFNGTDSPCRSELYCDTMQQKCAQRIALGAACETFAESCVQGAYCDGTAKVCTQALANDAPCTKNETCASRSCVNMKCAASGGSNLSLQLFCGSS
jgi:hypothetical protein